MILEAVQVIPAGGSSAHIKPEYSAGKCSPGIFDEPCQGGGLIDIR